MQCLNGYEVCNGVYAELGRQPTHAKWELKGVGAGVGQTGQQESTPRGFQNHNT
jgi:hypothetical protein